MPVGTRSPLGKLAAQCRPPGSAMMCLMLWAVLSAPALADIPFDQRPTDGTYVPEFLTSSMPATNKCANADAIPVILDYDMNIDDVVALAYLAKEPKYKIVAVVCTCTAFADCAMGASNTYRLLDLLGLQNVDVGIGPLYTTLNWDKTGFPSDFPNVNFDYVRAVPKASIYSANVLYGVYNDFLPYSRRHPTQINPGAQTMHSSAVYKKHVDMGATTVLTLGSMTSLHKFQVDHPDSFMQIQTLYAMFGAVDVEGNVFSVGSNAVAEFNAIADPHSARAVLSSAIPSITLVPLDATERVPMTPEYMVSLTNLTSAEGRFVSELTHRVRSFWWCGEACFYGMDANGEYTRPADAYFFWDPLAVAAMSRPELLTFESLKIEVVASDPPNLAIDGHTIRSETGKSMMVAMHVSDAQADEVRGEINMILDKHCIENQPEPLGALMQKLGALKAQGYGDSDGVIATCGMAKKAYRNSQCCGGSEAKMLG